MDAWIRIGRKLSQPLSFISQNLIRRYAILAAALFFVFFFIFMSIKAEYLLSEFVFYRHGHAETCAYCFDNDEFPKSQERGAIPNHLHQLFFPEKYNEIPPKYRAAQQSWRRQHPDWEYTIWNKTSVLDLIRRKYPQLEETYNGYRQWVQRTAAARYIILHQYGGWYVDMDMPCKNRLDSLSSAARHHNKSVVLRWTQPSGPSNDFFGVTPQNPFMLHVLNGLFNSDNWLIFPYPSSMFATGPMFLYGRVLNYPYAERDIHWLYNYSRYFDIMHDSSWHKWDGKFIWFFYNHGNQFKMLVFVVITSIVITYLFVNRRKYNLSNLSVYNKT